MATATCSQVERRGFPGPRQPLNYAEQKAVSKDFLLNTNPLVAGRSTCHRPLQKMIYLLNDIVECRPGDTHVTTEVFLVFQQKLPQSPLSLSIHSPIPRVPWEVARLHNQE